VRAMTLLTGVCRRGARVALASASISLLVSGSALAQAATSDPNLGALTFTGGLDVPTIYFFRGIRQEVKPSITLWPYGDIGLALFSGTGGMKSVGVNFGVWNSLQTGSSGLKGPSARLHYQEDFYTTLALGFGGGVGLATMFTARTSPNGMFNTIREMSLRLTKAHMGNPYGLVAFELSDKGQADGGSKKGTYLELGAGPSWAIGKDGPTLAIPVKVGLSLKNYYESGTVDNRFGFFDVGGLLTVPLKGVPGRFGSWNIHGGADVLVFGATTKLLNVNAAGEVKKSQVVGLVGIGLRY
jgi:hypothetical protein